VYIDKKHVQALNNLEKLQSSSGLFADQIYSLVLLETNSTYTIRYWKSESKKVEAP
jgi:hypothetical protein